VEPLSEAPAGEGDDLEESMPHHGKRRHEAEEVGKLREEAREIVRERIDELRGGELNDTSLTEAVEEALDLAKVEGLQAGLEEDVVDDVVRKQARRVVADEEHGRGRRSAKKSRHTTQVLRAAESRGDEFGRPTPDEQDE